MKTLPPKIMLAVAGIIVLFILFSLAQEMNRRIQVQREIVRLDTEARKLEKNLLEMENLNQYFKTEAFAELVAREKLNYKAEGEKVVLIPEQTNDTDIETARTDPQTKSIPRRWWDAFFSQNETL